jgi:DNA-binding LacI/PurR family transcriptional regulator
MRVNITELGAHAMRLLLDLQNGEDVSQRLAPLVPELIVRDSSRSTSSRSAGVDRTTDALHGRL